MHGMKFREIGQKAVMVGASMQRFQFHPVIADWFERRFGSPTAPQEEGWPAIQSGAPPAALPALRLR